MNLKSVRYYRRVLSSYAACARAVWARRCRRAREAARERTRFYEQVWREAAEAHGAEIRPLGYDIWEITRGDAVVRVSRNYTPLDDAVTLSIAGKKTIVYGLLQAEGIPVARHRVFKLRDLEPAIDFLREADGMCVVKPACGTGAGHGITTGVRTQRELIQAAMIAGYPHEDRLIESQIPGRNFRLLFLDGELLDAVERQPPGVVGDGTSTIRQLVQQENQRRLEEGFARSQVLIPIDLDLEHTLARHGWNLGSVPAAGTAIQLKTVINDNNASQNLSAAHLLCEEVVEAARRAANAIGVRLAGVDVVTPDPAVPLTEAGGVILEVNTTPGYYFHYHKADGSFPAAEVILGRLLDSSTRDGDVVLAFGLSSEHVS